MPELTESQKEEIQLTSEGFTINGMAEKYGVLYSAVYNYCNNKHLKYKHVEKRGAQRKRTRTTDIVPYADLLKEKLAVIPDPPRKWERPPKEYSNIQREDLIDKILNNGE